MKPYFSKHNQGASDTRTLTPCNCVRVYSVTGTVTISFNDGDEVPINAGDVFKCDFPGLFEKIKVTSSAGAAVVLIYGMGLINNIAGSSVSSGVVQNTVGSPEGVVSAENGQWAYETSTGALWVNPNTTGTAGWVNLIA